MFFFSVCSILLACSLILVHKAPRHGRVSQVETGKPEASVEARVTAALATLPMAFEANRGQTDPSVHFLARGRGYTMFLASGEAVLSLSTAKPADPTKTRVPARAGGLFDQIRPAYRGSDRVENRDRRSGAVRIRIIGGNPAAEVRGVDELPGKSNYFIGKEWGSLWTRVALSRPISPPSARDFATGASWRSSE